MFPPMLSSAADVHVPAPATELKWTRHGQDMHVLVIDQSQHFRHINMNPSDKHTEDAPCWTIPGIQCLLLHNPVSHLYNHLHLTLNRARVYCVKAVMKFSFTHQLALSF